MHPRKTYPKMGGTISHHPELFETGVTLLTMKGKALPRTWHVSNLKKLYV
ncbi:hypothetical protein BHM03_00031834 [Ensete ventricosum]|nr:hypothetical protein BHM03_00031834 [Ensete ventricosum]